MPRIITVEMLRERKACEYGVQSHFLRFFPSGEAEVTAENLDKTGRTTEFVELFLSPRNRERYFAHAPLTRHAREQKGCPACREMAEMAVKLYLEQEDHV